MKVKACDLGKQSFGVEQLHSPIFAAQHVTKSENDMNVFRIHTVSFWNLN